MSRDPESVIGAEDLADGMRVFSHGSGRTVLKRREQLGIPEDQGGPLCAFILCRLGWPPADAARILHVSRRTIRKWRSAVEQSLGA